MTASATATGYGPSASASARTRLFFDGDEKKYELWEVKFLGFMRLQKLHSVFVGNEPPSEEKNAEAFAELIQVIDDRSLSLIIRDAMDDGRKALEILREYYLGKSKPKVIALYTELTSLSKGVTESVTDYMLRAETASTSLKSAGEVISDSLLIAMILKGLPPDFKTLCTIITQKDKELTFAEFKVALRSFEETEKQTTQCDDTVMKINETKSVQCFACRKYGHKSYECKSRQQQTHKKTRWCEVCKSSTHDTKQCRKKKDTAKSVMADPSTDSFAFKVSECQSVCQDSLLVDCGATAHILTEKSKFTSFEQNFDVNNHCIELADGSRSNGIVQGRGTAKVCVQSSDGKSREVSLENVLYIPSYQQNIFSVLAATEKGATVNFSQTSAELTAPNGTTFDIRKSGKLYYLNSVANRTGESHSLREWHMILGHCNVKDVIKLETVVEGMKISDKSDFTCDVCTMGKMTQSFSRQSDLRATKPLELVHCDLCGPITPVAKDGFRYAISFVDDFSSANTVYFLRQKSDTTRAMEKFLADCAPIGKVERLRTDNGTEFTNDEFRSLMLKHCIKHEKSAPYSPHQNGTVERSWRSLFGMARCLLIESQLPKEMWTYAVRVAAYTRNRCFCQRTGKTPYESLTGKKPKVSHMSVFGSTCFAYVQDKKKLDPRSEKGIFVGYDNESPAYLVYFKESDTVRKVRCVRFTNRFDDISSVETSECVDDCEYREWNSDRKSDASGENSEHEPNVTDTSVSRNNDVEVETPSVDCTRRYPQRNTNYPKYLNDYVVDNDSVNVTMHYCYKMREVPVTYSEAISSPDSQSWKYAMKEEMDSLLNNDTFELTHLPEDRKVVGGRWVYAVKLGPNNEEQFKARYVAKGYSQVQDIDYHETFSPTARVTSIRMLMQLAAQYDLTVHQMDVKTAYLNAPIDCELYVEQPEGFVTVSESGEKLVLKLKKSLYGLKQSGRNWNSLLHEYLIDEHFEQSLADHCVYTRFSEQCKVIILVWVDDIIIAASDEHVLRSVKSCLCSRFSMKDIGPLSWFLGINFVCKPGEIEMNQSKYIENMLLKFNMSECKPRVTPCDFNLNRMKDDENVQLKSVDEKTYRAIVGSLIYAMSATRPDLCFIVTYLSQYMSKPTSVHMTMAKHVLRYLKGTSDYKLVFRKSDVDMNLTGFCDADWGNSEDRRSITGYGFCLSKNGPLISWKCRKQPTVALSTCEAEYMSMCAAVQESKFLLQLLKDMDLGIAVNETVVLNVDNQSAVALVKNPMFHQRSKHIDIRYHFVRDEVQNGNVQLQYVPSEDNVADMFTKTMSRIKLKQFIPRILGTIEQ